MPPDVFVIGKPYGGRRRWLTEHYSNDINTNAYYINASEFAFFALEDADALLTKVTVAWRAETSGAGVLAKVEINTSPSVAFDGTRLAMTSNAGWAVEHWDGALLVNAWKYMTRAAIGWHAPVGAYTNDDIRVFCEGELVAVSGAPQPVDLRTIRGWPR